MKKQNNIISEPGMTNQLKKGTIINGDLASESDARIDGIVNGNIDVKGKIIIGATGKITGDIKCSFCDIEGTVKGKLTIKNSLTLKSTANYSGEITTNKLIIEPSAVFNGSCKMDENKHAEGSFLDKK
ncbi:MAG: polymer-forming cytoskeletal protein [Bacteroidales bacterium]|nr:polymer-forming cytoskeletal protein [Bacteroidales bacterium]